MKNIKLFKTAEGWMATFSDPEVKKLFGSDTIPTGFTAQADWKTVLKEISKLNPQHKISISWKDIKREVKP